MHSHERRLAAIEERKRREAEKAAVSDSSAGSRRRFLADVCHAIGHVRRETLDRHQPFGYRRSMLASLEVEELAPYVVALRLRNHPDQDEAHALLRDSEEGSQYLPLVDNVVSRLRQLR